MGKKSLGEANRNCWDKSTLMPNLFFRIPSWVCQSCVGQHFKQAYSWSKGDTGRITAPRCFQGNMFTAIQVVRDGSIHVQTCFRSLETSLLFSALNLPGFRQQRWSWGFVDVSLFAPSLYAYKYEKPVYFYYGNIFTIHFQIAAAANTSITHQELLLLIAFSGFNSM